MKRRDVERALLAAGCTSLRHKGGHEVRGCPCGQHSTALPNHSEITAGVVGSMVTQMPCLSEGWLQ